MVNEIHLSIYVGICSFVILITWLLESLINGHHWSKREFKPDLVDGDDIGSLPANSNKMKPIRRIIHQLAIPIGLFAGGGFIYLALVDPPERIRMPIILSWIPGYIGWDSFFILIGVFLGLMIYWFCRLND